MGINNEQRLTIENTLKETIRKKIVGYNPETAVMPFHTRLLGKDRLALYSFIHSLNTNFGTTIFEPIAQILAQSNFYKAKLQIKPYNHISESAQRVIQSIMDGLISTSLKPNKSDEVDAIRKVCRDGGMKVIKPTRIDLCIEKSNHELFFIDIKTAKPNIGNFHEFKRTLLEWVAVTLAQNPRADIKTLIAIPYNPYEPRPYSRWTMAGMLDLTQELKVAEEFWDFLGGQGTYSGLLSCFEHVGIELRKEIDECFKMFNI